MEKVQAHETRRKEFEKLRHLNMEIALDCKRLRSLVWMLNHPKALAQEASKLNAELDRDMLAAEAESIRQSLDEKVGRTFVYYKDVLNLVNEIDDPRIRAVISLRCLDCLEWADITKIMGRSNGIASERKPHSFFR